MNPFILRQPAITEKAYRGMDKSIYTFWVEPTATKGQIKLAVESTFGVNVMAVNTVPVNGKTKRTGRRRMEVRGAGRKKAIVRLKAGQTIEMLQLAEEQSKTEVKEK
jgi:large subunit ribosomal protein L23